MIARPADHSFTRSCAGMTLGAARAGRRGSKENCSLFVLFVLLAGACRPASRPRPLPADREAASSPQGPPPPRPRSPRCALAGAIIFGLTDGMVGAIGDAAVVGLPLRRPRPAPSVASAAYDPQLFLNLFSSITRPCGYPENAMFRG